MTTITEGTRGMKAHVPHPLEGVRCGVRTREGQWWFTPHEDITAYELALCLGVCLANASVAFEALPVEAQRHFVNVRGERKAGG